MSSAYRYGAWDGAFGGETASEMARGRTDAREDEIRRRGQRIDVMSEEEWQRRTAQAARQRQAWHERLGARQARRGAAAPLSDEERAQPLIDRYVAEVNLQRQYRKQLPKKLRDYHAAPEGTLVSRDDWDDAYEDVGHFLAAALLAYHYQVDSGGGGGRSVMGPDVGSCRNHNLQLDIPKAPNLECYFEHRGLSASDDELRYFKGCVAQKVSTS